MKKYFLPLLFIFSFFNVGFSQKKQRVFQDIIDSLLISQPKTYVKINRVLLPFRRDTSKLKQLISVFENANFLDGKAYAENMLGIQYKNFSQYIKAIETHKQALETSKKAKSIEFRVFSLNMLGVDYRKIGENPTALDYNQEALALAESVENPDLGLRRGIAIAHNSMGKIYSSLNQHDQAIEQFQESLMIEQSIDNKKGFAINNENIGREKEAQGKLDEALAHFQESLKINSDLDNVQGIVVCNISIASLYIKQGKPEEAISLIEDNFSIVESLGNKEYLVSNYLNLGWAQTKLKQYTDAEPNLLEGIKIAKKYNITKEISARGYSYLSELHQQKNNFKEALKFYKLAKEYDEKISNNRNKQYVNNLIIRYDNERENNQIKALTKQNEIKELTRNRNLWIISLSFLTLTGVVLFSFSRHRTLNSEKKILTLKQDALQSQMNPHFMFNALNSIKLYIINNDQKNATSYLNKFSKLMRKILEASSLKVTSLAEELETMKLYMSIENIRFSNEIDFQMNINPNINLDTIKIPPLVLQPFLENSLWHGLSSKKDSKKVVLSVEQISNSFIQIDIQDNGIGREAATKIKAKKSTNQKSIGINLTRKRLKNFVKGFKNGFSLAYEDLKDTSNQPIGTKVRLIVPLF